MHIHDTSSFGFRILTGLAAFVIVVAGMKSAEPILVPFLLSVFIAIISAPPLFWLERHRVPVPIAVLIMISGIIIVMILIGMLAGASIKDFTHELPQYQSRLRVETSGIITWLGQRGIDLSNLNLQSVVDPGKAMGLAANMLNSFGGMLSDGLLIFFTVVFIMTEASSFPVKLRAIYGEQASLGIFDSFIVKVKNYMVIKTIISLLTGLMIAAWLAILGVDYPLLWGLTAFLFNYVPTIGSIIAAIPAILLALIQIGSGTALLAALGYIIINVIFGNIIEPRYMGRGLGLSALVVFLSLVFWGWVLGPIGMLLSVPLTMTVKIALDSHDDTRWLGILLDSESPTLSSEENPPDS